MAVETRRNDKKVAPKLFARRRMGRLLVRAEGQPRHRIPLPPDPDVRSSTSGEILAFFNVLRFYCYFLK